MILKIRQKIVNGWSIDFYIKPIDKYVQFDGVYWHGLDRSLDKIKKLEKPRDKRILDTYLLDRRQDSWFEENKLNLFRITDRQFNKIHESELLYLIG